MNKMLKKQLGKTMEVYIDDMVLKSMKSENHLQVLEEVFNILDKFNMVLKPSKCHFGVKVGVTTHFSIPIDCNKIRNKNILLLS